MRFSSMFALTPTLLATCALASLGVAQSLDWHQRSPGTSPPPRNQHAMAYDSARQRVVLFGGSDYSRRLDDTWEWDGSTWTRMTPPVSPPPRNLHAMVYDSARQRTVLFGGRACAAAAASCSNWIEYQDTWEWNGTTWTQRFPKTTPPPRASFGGMAYDSARQRTVLFGGMYYSQPLSDTWEWDGSDWSNVTAPISCSNSSLPRRRRTAGSAAWCMTPRGSAW